MKLRDRIIHQMCKSDYVPLQKDELIAQLRGKKNERAELEQAIQELLKKGEIVLTQKKRLVVPRDANLVSGKIVFKQSGSALLISESSDGKQPPPPVRINAEHTGVAMHNDRVVVRLESPSRSNARRHDSGQNVYGRVIRILERARTQLIGSLQKSRLAHYVTPDDPRYIQDIYVGDPARTGLKPVPIPGDKVVVDLHEWTQRHMSPEGDIVEVLGKTNEPGAELKAIFRKFHLDQEFPESLEKELSKIPDHVRKSELKGREDLRDVFTFTIDPDDAKDFDDALSAETLPDGEIQIGIHIADVGHYVKSGSELDKEARRRGNSTYLVGTVIPMLPRKLSNGLCSLVENEDRLTKSVFFIFSPQGKLRETTFANSVIRSNKRLTYKQAYALLKEDDLQKVRAAPVPAAHQTGSTGRTLDSLSDAELKELQTGVRQLWFIASRLRKHRMDTGSLDLDVPETKLYVNEEGYADRIEIIEYDESHQLIEEFMLMANEAVAIELTRNKIPALHRIHEKPYEEKLNEYRDFLATHGIQAGNLGNRQEIKKVLERVKDHPQSHSLRIQFLRSLQRARYMAVPKGHYGLNKKHYTHFTSPIRRYSDLAVHRLFEMYLDKFTDAEALPKATRHYTQADLDQLGDHLTATEQNSTEAEREHVKLKLLEFFERELSKPERTQFSAVITDVRNHGLFIELLESQAFGFVHISTLPNDLYAINPAGDALTGRRSKNSFEMGQKVSVVTERVDRFKRQLDFRIVEQGAEGKPKKQTKAAAKGSGKSQPKSQAKPKGTGKPKGTTKPKSSAKAKPKAKSTTPVSRKRRRDE